MDRVRAAFPALASSDPWVFADNAGGSQTLRSVVDRVADYLLTTNVQLGATYDVSVRSTARVKEGQAAGAVLFNAASAHEIFFAASSSMATQNIATAMAPTLTANDEIIVTNFDHEANVGAWLRMAAASGATVKHWEIDRATLRPSLETLRGLLSPRTRFVACTHASNILGTINDIKAIAALVHTIPGAEILQLTRRPAGEYPLNRVDGVAYAPHRRIDVQELGVDYYVFSVYKVYGPHFSIFYGSEKAVARLGTINHSFLATSKLEQHPYKLQPGNVNPELMYSLPAIVEYLASLGTVDVSSPAKSLASGFEWITRQEQALMDHFMPFLLEQQQQGTITIIGAATADQSVRVPTVSFVVHGHKASEVPPLLDSHKIGIRWGHFYSKRLIDYLGLGEADGVVRVSFVHYNTVDEVDRLVGVLRSALKEVTATAPSASTTTVAAGGYGI